MRIRTFALFSLTYGIVGLFWERIETGYFSIEGPIVGVAIGVTLATLEETKLGKFTRSMPFTKAVVVKSALYLAVLAIPVLITGFIVLVIIILFKALGISGEIRFGQCGVGGGGFDSISHLVQNT